MIIIALVSPTGGAGRTSLASAAATQLSLLGRPVTLIQADPTNNIEFQLGFSASSPRGLAHLLLHSDSLESVLEKTGAGFQLLPFGQTTVAEQLDIDQVLLKQPDRLIKLLQQDQFTNDAMVIVDLPRWPNAWCHAVMALSDLNLVILTPDSGAILGIDGLLPNLLESRGASYFLMNRFDSSKVLHLDLWTLCKMKLSHRLLPFYLHEDQALAESIAAGISLADYAPRSQLVDDQQKLCNWIDSEIG